MIRAKKNLRRPSLWSLAHFVKSALNLFWLTGAVRPVG
jgi:hypothetical protein